MNNFSDDLYPLALLMDELKHDDVSNRVEAMQNWTPLLCLGTRTNKKRITIS